MAQQNLILMTLLINQWYLESQKPLVTLFMSPKNGENFSNSKVPESDWKGDFRVSRKSIYELCAKLHPYLQKKQNRLRSPMSVEIEVVYYITVEGPIGKLQMLLVFLEHQFRL